MAGKVARRDVRLFRFSQPGKQRPALVLTRDSTIDHISRITVAPVTSPVRGVASELVLGPEDGMKNVCAVNLHNIVTVPKAGLGRLVVTLDARKMDQLCSAIAFALGCSR